MSAEASPLPPLFFADRSARGRVALAGRDRQTFLQGMVTNDVASLAPGAGSYAFLLDATGHVLADARVLCGATYLLLDVEPGSAGFVAQTLEKYLIMEKCRITDLSDSLAQILVGGADAPALLHSLFGIADAADWHEGQNAPLATAGSGGEADGTVAATCLLTVPAFDLYFSVAARDALIARFQAAGAVRVSDAQIETGRIEAGVPRMGADIDARVLAPETGQEARAIHRRKGCYIGQEIVARIDARGHANRTLAGFRLSGDALPASGATVEAEGRDVGRVTSVTFSPTLGGAPIALGYVRNEFAAPGTVVTVGGAEATVAALPFVDNAGGVSA